MAKPLKKNRPFAENVADIVEHMIRTSNIRRVIGTNVQVPNCFVRCLVNDLRAGQVGELIIPLIPEGIGCKGDTHDAHCKCQEKAKVFVEVKKVDNNFNFRLMGWRYSDKQGCKAA